MKITVKTKPMITDNNTINTEDLSKQTKKDLIEIIDKLDIKIDDILSDFQRVTNQNSELQKALSRVNNKLGRFKIGLNTNILNRIIFAIKYPGLTN